MSEAETFGELLARANRENIDGNPAGAIEQLNRALIQSPGNPSALNMMGLILMNGGRHGDAVAAFERAVTSDPGAPPLWLNLGTALEKAGRPKDALGALDKGLECDPYYLPALLKKGQLYEALGQSDLAVRSYRAVLQALPATGGLPPEFDQALARGRALVADDARQRRERLGAIDGLANVSGSGAKAYLDQICGLRQVYAPAPTGPHFPFLPAPEFFDRDLFPWFDRLEAGVEAIRDELLDLWREDAPGFEPYIQYDPTKPLNQWVELNKSPRWSAYSLWTSGMREEANCSRCPRTAEILAGLPLLDIPGKGPAVMFSILAPKTRIPPHTGTTNIRSVVHLPLVVPDGCGFRVGGEIRQWVEGEAWAFDDTIEHEAWNDSDRPRAILIIDVWNPYLSEADRDVVRLSAPEIRL
ncbi:aspartyl/asparaginyl beta-hydroxylase domain-containing protein [Sphingomonas sp. RB56-2]|uniref:Aspartyl/asparaginyl beta-hydroxylase domain-containing protein n=1 Tax=Sphingomonas brevis TaxID=2908206 RepID=A0ABT0S6D5_9SPHN|nr:aspartyl/asparaginyl beta-hydroxylase domain-containing protein [Sphingomonas brevis]MCL6739937.1 aspartyl/asparaginyl beta-hydroxylase domain-containing protein [Sphingomonas brevis]